MTQHIKTIILQDATGINQRLTQLGLTYEGLKRVVHAAIVERNNATGLHPVNAPGTFAYHHGIAAIRREFLGEEWVSGRHDGIETICSKIFGIKVSFCNVDNACGRDHPKPRSAKGAGAERASGQNLFEYAGIGNLAHYAPKPVNGSVLYYLMVDQQGRAELTCPVISRGTFIAAAERIFIIEDVEENTVLLLDTDDIADNFDPQIVRK